MIYRGEREERGLTGEGRGREGGRGGNALEIIIAEISSISLSSSLPYPAGLLLEVHLPEPGVEAGEGVEGEHQVEARPDKCLHAPG